MVRCVCTRQSAEADTDEALTGARPHHQAPRNERAARIPRRVAGREYLGGVRRIREEGDGHVGQGRAEGGTEAGLRAAMSKFLEGTTLAIAFGAAFCASAPAR